MAQQLVRIVLIAAAELLMLVAEPMEEPIRIDGAAGHLHLLHHRFELFQQIVDVRRVGDAYRLQRLRFDDTIDGGVRRIGAVGGGFGRRWCECAAGHNNDSAVDGRKENGLD